MSKAKKIISMILAVALVLSIAPVSVFASALTPTATFTKPKITDVTFTTDTSATTEVIRVAGAAGIFTLGTTVVPATPAGIPEATGTFIDIAYAGATPSYPVIVFTIDGVQPNARPSITTNLGGNLTIAPYGNVESSGTKHTYRWTVTGGTATTGTDVVYTISYKVGDVDYETHAHAHVEDILIMNGFVGIKQYQNWIGTDKSRHAHIVQLQSKNMYSGMHGETTGSREQGFINYASVNPYNTDDKEDCLLGTEKGSTDLASGGSNAYATQTANSDIVGTKKAALIKFRNETGASVRNGCFKNDGNRSESTVYMDKRTDTLQSLGMKISLQSARRQLWNKSRFQGVTFMASQYTCEDNTRFSDIAATMPTSEATASTDTSNITTLGGYKYATVSGTGPALQTSVASYAYSVVIGTYSDNNNSDWENYELGVININFNVYNTYDLYYIYQSITCGYNVLTGNNQTFTTQYLNYISGGTNTTVTFNKGAHPQASYYTGGWSTFHDAYVNAGKILAKPDTNQTEINNATTALINAYNGLTGYTSTVNYEVKHYLVGTTQEIVTDANNTYAQRGTVASGSKIEAYAATITGYDVSGDTVKQVTATGEKATETIAFYYTPKSYQVIATTYNDAGEVHPLNYQYNTTVDVSEIPYGTKANWEFAGWYTKDGTATGNWDESARVTADFVKDTDTIYLFARWQTAPINVYCDTQIDGVDLYNLGSVRPNELTSVQFQRPADPVVDGYLFVEFYKDAALTELVTWPLTFNLGDPDMTVYGRFVDVNQKIIFESNGGTAVPDTAFKSGDTVYAPDEPTKVGYDFAGWYYDRELTNAVTWPREMTSNTGFIAYAKWTPKQVTINFNTNVGTRPTKYDTVNVPSITGTVGDPITSEFVPAEPRRFGYIFSHWASDTGTFSFDNATYPASDEPIELVAIWRATDDSAFIDLSATQMILGEAQEVEKVHTGDVVTVRMSTKTNFYTGSSLFIIMYDADFYELVGSGKNAVTLNRENDYISGINAKYTVVTNSNSLPWPKDDNGARMFDGYNAVQVAIDPTVAADNYNCEPMADGTWMIEFKLKVKDDATGSGTIFMDNAWTRDANNPAGTMFYGWANSASTTVVDTYNNKVTPDLQDATVTLTIDETPQATTTVTLNPNGGAWTDGTTANKTYTGVAGKEIVGYASPSKTGYDLTGWQNASDASDTWIEGYYSPADKDNREYVAQWTAKTFSVKFFTEVDGTTVHKELTVAYMSEIAAPAEPTRQGYTFAGWVDENGQTVTLPVTLSEAADKNFYATWTPATDTAFKFRAYYPNPNYDATNPDSKQYNQMDISMTGTTGYTVAVVESIPDPAAANTHYYTADTLPTAANGNYVFDPDNANNVLPKTDVIKADGSTIIELYYIGKLVNATFDANGGQYADASTSLVVPGRFQSAVVAPTGDAAPTRFGYDLTGWSPNITATTKYLRDTTYKAQWTAKTVHVQFMNGDAQYGELVETQFGKAPAAPTAPIKSGYEFVGWSTDPNATSGVTTLPVVDAIDNEATGIAVTYYAIFTLSDVYVNYYLDGEPYGATETYKYGDSVTIREAAAKKGYTFSGWKIEGNDAADFTMPDHNVVIEGSFTANTIGVVFNADEGSFTSGKEMIVDTIFDQAINLPAEEPKKAGYTFAGWATEANAETGSTDLGILTEEAATYYAVFTANEVTYYIDVYTMGTDGQYGAPETTTGTAKVDSEVTITSDEIDGFTLLTGASQTETVPAETELRFTVRYERNKYSINYNVDGAITTNEYYYEEAITPIADPAKTGYTFTGWSPEVPATMPIGGKTVEAIWSTNSYNVKFYTDDTKATVHYNNDVEYLTAMPVPMDPTSNTHNFAGWAYEGTTDIVDLATLTVPANDVVFVGIWTPKEFTLNYRTYNGLYETYQVAYGTAQADLPVPATDPTRVGYTFAGWSGVPATMPAANTNIVAEWTINQYTITFDVDGGTDVAPITQDYDTAIDAPADPTKTGYTFAGWDTEIPEKMPANDMTIKAQWTINQYTITFDTVGGNAIEAITGDYGTAVVAPADPTKAGYTFAGWDVEIPATIPAENVTIKANWTINQYTITFNTDGGTAIAPITQDYNTAVTKPADPTKTGYTFAGWDVAVPSTMPANDMTITAQWTVNQYTITFDVDGGSAVAPITQDYGTDVTAPAAPTKAGYTFAGWDTEIPATMPANNMTIKAQWTINQYTITFNVDGGTAIAPITQNYGTVVIAPAAPEKTGYTFAGWDTTIPSTMPANDMTITAQWTVNQYTIKFANTGDVTIADISGDYGTAVQAPAAPTKVGYTFAGWDVEIPATIPAENMTITAKWTVNQYTITFVTNGGTEIAAITDDFGATIPVISNPTKVGHTFAGWDKAIPVTMPAEDMTITASWTVNKYQITFYDAIGDVIKQEMVDYGTEIATLIPAEQPTKNHYTFEGWSLTEGSETGIAPDAFGTMPASAVSYYPALKRVVVTLTIAAGSTTVIDTDVETADDEITGYIYGLEDKLTKAKLESQYISVQGDGTLRITPSWERFNLCGTGTKVEVIDNVTGETVETYYVIIFGDVNGDSGVDATDVSVITSETHGMTGWSNDASEDYNECYVFAGNLAGDDFVTIADIEALREVILYRATIDQTTGDITPNA